MYLVMTLVGTAIETVHSRATVGRKRAEGLNVLLGAASTPSSSTSRRRFCSAR